MKKVTGFLGSVLGRLMLIIGGIAAMVYAAIFISLTVFQSTSVQLKELSEQRVAVLVSGQALSEQVAQIQSTLPHLLTADETAGVAEAHKQLVAAMAQARSLSEALPPEEATEIAPILASTETALKRLAAARETEFAATHDMTVMLETARNLALEASRALEVRADDTYFEVVTGGEQSVAGVNTLLDQLVYEDFALLQSTLAVRNQFELLMGSALGLTQTRDPALRAILTDLGQTALIRLHRTLPELSGNPFTFDAADAISSALPVIEKALTAGARVAPSAILALRPTVETRIVTALDDLSFSLVMQSEAAAAQTSRTLGSLLNDKVEAIRDQGQLDHATLDVIVTAFDLSLTHDTMLLKMLEGTLADKSAKLANLIASEPEALRTTIAPILALGDPDSGIAQYRRAALAAHAQVAVASDEASENVRHIAASMSEMMGGAVTRIDETAASLTAKMTLANNRLTAISAASVALLILGAVLAWWLIARPLAQVTGTTERLAQGDLSPLRRMPRAGEMGRLAQALETFRQAAEAQIRTQKEKDAAEAAARAQEAQAVEERRRAEQAAHAAELQRTQDEQQRKEEEAAREKALQSRAEAERRAQEQEQADVVHALAQGLQKLATGDLRARIDTAFPGAYEDLRTNYNTAIANLSVLVSDLRSAAERIDGNTREIASAADSLAQRTERNAATLEETAAAIEEMTLGAGQQADGAKNANGAAQQAHDGAENGREVMAQAVDSMDEIRNSSDQIEKITSLIEDIAFQTNLLALNAGVEAARAGSAGQGFAVVASEVRALAQRSADAAKNIADLIKISKGQIVQGVDRVGNASDTLEQIIEQVDSVTAKIGDIHVSAEEQKSTVTDINRAVRALDSDAQANAAMFEETKAATHYLAQEAQSLAQLVEQFSLPDLNEHKSEEIPQAQFA